MRGSNVREFKLPYSVVFGGSAIVGLALTAALHALRVDVGLNLTVVGLVLAILLPAGVEMRNRSGRPRRVLILDYRAHQYGHAVARGAMRTFNADKRRWMVDRKAPASAEAAGSVQWQIRELQAASIDDIDGIILVPAGDDENLWYALAATIKGGAFVVVVDTKPPNKVFRDVGIEPPRFVSSRYSETGVIIGSLLNDWLAEDPARSCLLWVGPDGSWPGEERSRNILWELARCDQLDRTQLYRIDSWTPDVQRCRDAVTYVQEAGGNLAVYCADDENALALHLYTLTEHTSLRSSMFIIGCNGTPDDWGNVQAVDMRAVDATVDILAEEQGVQAAVLFIKERNAKLPASDRSVFIPPKLVRRSASNDRWLDSIFDHAGAGEVGGGFVPATETEMLRLLEEASGGEIDATS